MSRIIAYGLALCIASPFIGGCQPRPKDYRGGVSVTAEPPKSQPFMTPSGRMLRYHDDSVVSCNNPASPIPEGTLFEGRVLDYFKDDHHYDPLNPRLSFDRANLVFRAGTEVYLISRIGMPAIRPLERRFRKGNGKGIACFGDCARFEQDDPRLERIIKLGDREPTRIIEVKDIFVLESSGYYHIPEY